MFLEECTQRFEGEDTPKVEMYDTYRSWCLRNGHNPLAHVRFATVLAQLSYISKRGRDANRVRVYAWENVRLMPEGFAGPDSGLDQVQVQSRIEKAT